VITSFDLSYGWVIGQYVRTVADLNGNATADLLGFN
jgi:hypothetical protein